MAAIFGYSAAKLRLCPKFVPASCHNDEKPSGIEKAQFILKNL